MAGVNESVPVTVVHNGEETVIEAEEGTVLRDLLLEYEFPVYGSISKHANCGGRGLCGTCGVELTPPPEPEHWHDSAAAQFGYPRLSCCVTVSEPVTVRLLDKQMWGQLLPRPKGSPNDD